MGNLLLLQVSLLVCEPEIEPGLKLNVTPLGGVEVTERVTEPVKPLLLVRLIVLVAVEPSTTVSVEGETVRAKSGLDCASARSGAPPKMYAAIKTSSRQNSCLPTRALRVEK